MSFKLTRTVALKACGDQVEALITMPRLRNTVWTPESLHKHLTELGLDYTLEEVGWLNDEMHKRRIVEDIAEPKVEPEVEPDVL